MKHEWVRKATQCRIDSDPLLSLLIASIMTTP